MTKVTVQLDELYQEIILDHWKHPRGRGLREPAEPAVGAPHRHAESHQVNPTCGDEITLRVGLSGDEQLEISYEGLGCSISQASASVLYELVDGRPLGEAMKRYDAFAELVSGRGQVEPDEELLEDGIAFAGVAKYPARVKCALLAWMAFRDAAARAAGSVDGGGAG